MLINNNLRLFHSLSSIHNMFLFFITNYFTWIFFLIKYFFKLLKKYFRELYSNKLNIISHLNVFSYRFKNHLDLALNNNNFLIINFLKKVFFKIKLLFFRISLILFNKSFFLNNTVKSFNNIISFINKNKRISFINKTNSFIFKKHFFLNKKNNFFYFLNLNLIDNVMLFSVFLNKIGLLYNNLNFLLMNFINYSNYLLYNNLFFLNLISYSNKKNYRFFISIVKSNDYFFNKHDFKIFFIEPYFFINNFYNRSMFNKNIYFYFKYNIYFKKKFYLNFHNIYYKNLIYSNHFTTLLNYLNCFYSMNKNNLNKYFYIYNKFNYNSILSNLRRCQFLNNFNMINRKKKTSLSSKKFKLRLKNKKTLKNIFNSSQKKTPLWIKKKKILFLLKFILNKEYNFLKHYNMFYISSYEKHSFFLFKSIIKNYLNLISFNSYYFPNYEDKYCNKFNLNRSPFNRVYTLLKKSKLYRKYKTNLYSVKKFISHIFKYNSFKSLKSNLNFFEFKKDSFSQFLNTINIYSDNRKKKKRAFRSFRSTLDNIPFVWKSSNSKFSKKNKNNKYYYSFYKPLFSLKHTDILFDRLYLFNLYIRSYIKRSFLYKKSVINNFSYKSLNFLFINKKFKDLYNYKSLYKNVKLHGFYYYKKQFRTLRVIGEGINYHYFRDYSKEIHVYYFLKYFNFVYRRNKNLKLLYRFFIGLNKIYINNKYSYDKNNFGTIIYNNTYKNIYLTLLDSKGKTLKTVSSGLLRFKNQHRRKYCNLLTLKNLIRLFFLRIKNLFIKNNIFNLKILLKGSLDNIDVWLNSVRSKIFKHNKTYFNIYKRRRFQIDLKKYFYWFKYYYYWLKKKSFSKSYLLNINIFLSYMHRFLYVFLGKYRNWYKHRYKNKVFSRNHSHNRYKNNYINKYNSKKKNSIYKFNKIHNNSSKHINNKGYKNRSTHSKVFRSINKYNNYSKHINRNKIQTHFFLNKTNKIHRIKTISNKKIYKKIHSHKRLYRKMHRYKSQYRANNKKRYKVKYSFRPMKILYIKYDLKKVYPV